MSQENISLVGNRLHNSLVGNRLHNIYKKNKGNMKITYLSNSFCKKNHKNSKNVSMYATLCSKYFF